jgi:hypothetical protein
VRVSANILDRLLHAQNQNILSALVKIQREIEKKQAGSPLKRGWAFLKDPDTIAEFKTVLDEALKLFHVRAFFI